MEIGNLLTILGKIQGCTFATLDSTTVPKKGIIRTSVGERAILFTNSGGSGYENMVKRRLEEAGKDPGSFILGDLPWGQRVPNMPLVTHKGNFYLQFIQLAPGLERYWMGGRQIQDPAQFGLINKPLNQGLSSNQSVRVFTYKVENIDRIAVMGEVLVNDLPGAIADMRA